MPHFDGPANPLACAASLYRNDRASRQNALFVRPECCRADQGLGSIIRLSAPTIWATCICNSSYSARMISGSGDVTSSRMAASTTREAPKTDAAPLSEWAC